MEDWVENARMITESAGAIIPRDQGLGRVREQRFEGCGFDPATMRKIADMGWLTMRVAEDDGGSGIGLREFCELMRVLGRGLVPEPVLSSSLAHRLVAGRVPDAVASGDAVIVTAWQDRAGSLAWQHMRGDRLSGKKAHVPGAAGADIFAVVTAQGIALVPREASGLTIGIHAMQDGSFFADLVFDDVEAKIVAKPDVAACLDEAIVAQSAYLLGVSERAMEITLDYLRVREQFGRPIGSFQALQHRMSELKISLELSRAAIFATAGRFDGGMAAGVRSAAASRVKARAADLGMDVAREVIQMHGAIGYSDEADIGLFARKIMTEANHFGSAALHRARFLETDSKEAA